MASIGPQQHWCTECGAHLPLGEQPKVCEVCLRQGAMVRHALPLSFYLDLRIMVLLDRLDFGGFLRAVRAHTGWSLPLLSTITEISQADLHAIEHGRWQLREFGIIRRLAQRLFIPRELLGFTNPDPSLAPGDQDEPVAPSQENKPAATRWLRSVPTDPDPGPPPQ